MADYDKLAPFYDKIHASRQQTIEYITHLINEYHPSAKTLLSLACGTGAVLKSLSKKYIVEGLDISAGMLQVARKKMPKVIFHEADMCHFELNKKFDVITCLYASLNHVCDFKDWRALFKTVKQHLNPGGLFIFDVISETGLYNMALNSPLVIKRFNHLSVGDIRMDESGEFSIWRAHGYRYFPKSKTPLYDITVRQVAFSLEAIQEALSEYFAEIDADDPESSQLNEASELYYFICR